MTGKKTILRIACGLFSVITLMFTPQVLLAQKTGVKQFRIKDNLMLIILSRSLPIKDVDEFTLKYNVAGIGLHQLIGTGKPDSVQLMGWKVDESDPNLYVVTKPLQSVNTVNTPPGKIIFSPVPTPDDWRIVGGNRVIYGVNSFKSGKYFRRSGDTIYFYLRGHRNANRVRLAGNFTNWQHGAFPMTKGGDGWVVPVKLKAGQYYYKFIINDGEWITDPDNEITENDGKGNENSVYYVTNKKFQLKGYENAANVFLAGSFNNWMKNKLRLEKTNGIWQIDMYLEPGTYEYNYYVDGATVSENDEKDPAGQQSKVSLGDAYRFTLKGFQNAKKVVLAGNFNDWKPGELYMQRTADGWQTSYALGPGNYQYKFIVDGKWITDPSNPQVINDGKGNVNSYLIIGANYRFRLKGFKNAKKVNLAGDFNDWSPEGLPMQHAGDEWICAVRLAKGKHLYKFIVDGGWMRDPVNPDWETDEHGNDNSVIWIE